jgi:hypothetical protein
MFLLPLLLLDEDGLGDEVGTIFFYMSAIEHLLQLVQSSLRMQRESCVININKRMTISRNHMTFSATNYLDLLIAVPLFFRAFFFFLASSSYVARAAARAPCNPNENGKSQAMLVLFLQGTTQRACSQPFNIPQYRCVGKKRGGSWHGVVGKMKLAS